METSELVELVTVEASKVDEVADEEPVLVVVVGSNIVVLVV